MTAYTQPIELKDITDTVVRHVPLQSIRGIKYVPSSVEVSVCVDMYSEKTVEVPVVGFDFPKGKILRTFPSKVQVTFQVGLSYFKSITANDFYWEYLIWICRKNRAIRPMSFCREYPIMSAISVFHRLPLIT